jgi:hyperosmotically inducible protein
MKIRLLAFASLVSFVPMSSIAQNSQLNQTPSNSADRISHEVRYELLMLPGFGVFDNIDYRVSGGTVTLTGDVLRPALKTEAENAVTHIEGVEKAMNEIRILPHDRSDRQLRFALFRAIYQYPSLQKYELGVLKPIRIIVNHRRVRLEGVVLSEPDRELAGVRARSVPGTRSVANDLQVAEPRQLAAIALPLY